MNTKTATKSARELILPKQKRWLARFSSKVSRNVSYKKIHPLTFSESIAQVRAQLKKKLPKQKRNFEKRQRKK